VIFILWVIGDGMKFLGIICLLAVLVPVSSAGSEFYRYTDPHGNIIYTDDISRVPDAQRENAGVSEQQDFIPFGAGASAAPPETVSPSKDALEDLKIEQEQLEALKAKLELEFKSLAHENARLKAAQKKAITPDQRKAFNKEVVSFNTRFQAYKEKEAAYKSRRDKVNKRFDAAKSDADKE
jgi:hypothetical protein